MEQTDPELKNLDELIELYLLRCEVEGKTPRTVLAYRETPASHIDLGNMVRLSEAGFESLAFGVTALELARRGCVFG